MSRKKVLYLENVNWRINNFSHSSMLAYQKLGYEFHIAANWSGYDDEEIKKQDEQKYNVTIKQIDMIRKPYDLRNIKAYKQLVNLIKKERYAIIHCNTPTGGLLGRLAGSKCRVPTIIYQAHGFHFYKGAPLRNWLIYYPIEKWLAHKTNVLIAINDEDYERARKKMRVRCGGSIAFLPGVGIESALFSSPASSREKTREKMGLTENDFAIISAGDLIKRKNYRTAIKAINAITDKNIKYFICGEGPEKKKLMSLIISANLQNRVFLMGFRRDIKELMNASDLFLLSSVQEGLPRSLMEAMASGLPCVASRIRGNTDLIKDGENGFLCRTKDQSQYAHCIETIAHNKGMALKMRNNNVELIKSLDIERVTDETVNLLKKVLNK